MYPLVRKSPKKEQKMNIIKEKVAIRVPGAKEGKHEEIRTRCAFSKILFLSF